MIFDVMNDQLSNKNPEMIRRILEKCQWRIELALDELMLEINENK
jgi:ppGpp synthetase/RelA/SpoT-type nucleotidyltranferase